MVYYIWACACFRSGRYALATVLGAAVAFHYRLTAVLSSTTP